ncbi:triose-phosphate isomerase, partial [Staphylococcus warneri]|uniref:triose-phosphate isomerase n=1 Tax=Staphylococcus warneri TaxID=1292 RepID=UPI0011A1E8DF
ICGARIELDGLMRGVKDGKGKGLEMGAENGYFEDNGGLTGESCGVGLGDLGVKYVVMGECEGGELLEEREEEVNKKGEAI